MTGRTLATLAMVGWIFLAPSPRIKAEAPPGLTTLVPGSLRELTQQLTVNIVFVGYRAGAGVRGIDETAMRAVLPHTYRAIDRNQSYYSQFISGVNTYAGLSFSYRYNVTFAPAAFEDAFFGYAGRIGEAQPLTEYQRRYNSQASRSLTVTDNVHIDAPSIERWLAANAGSIGVDARQYTIFFINWYDRPDFRFHVYTKTNEPDPDTGYNFGTARESRKILGWGGTAPDDPENGSGMLARVWFFDLSAGPEAVTGSFDLDRADLDEDGVLDYRMPPIWEYGNLGAYRPFDTLSVDLGLLIRYVAIDMLFSASPIFKPAISAPALPSQLDLDVSVYQIDPSVDGKTFFKPEQTLARIRALQPFNTFRAHVREIAFRGDVERTYGCWLSANGPTNFVAGHSCYGNRLFGLAFLDLQLFHMDHLTQFLDGDADYEVPVFLYNATDALRAVGLSGLADDNLRDGTQFSTNVWGSPTNRTLGYGFTTHTTHEVGHHLGLSHPHDGYDSETDVDFFPSGPLYFVWAGDESSTVMSYLALDNDFSQFDRDNMNRWMTAVYINYANAILARIDASPRAPQVTATIVAADAQATRALQSFAVMDYAAGVAQAKAAYQGVMAAAAAINVPIEREASPADYKALGRSYALVDPLRGHSSMP